MNKLIITNNYAYVSKQIANFINGMELKDLNFIKIDEKLEINSIVNELNTFPIMDSFKVIMIEVNIFTITELKAILSNFDANSTSKILAIYFIKSKLEKCDSKITTLFQKYNFEIKKSLSITEKDVKELIQSKNINCSPHIFLNADNFDVVINDLEKLSFLSDYSDCEKYISKSFDSNVFELINYILRKDVTNMIVKLRDLLVKENPVVLNIVILKHLNSLRTIRTISNIEDIANILATREKVCGGKGNKIHPYRLKLLIDSANKTQINLDYAVNLLLKNDILKKFDLEMSLLKIINC